jgi:hypothetical protein
MPSTIRHELIEQDRELFGLARILAQPSASELVEADHRGAIVKLIHGRRLWLIDLAGKERAVAIFRQLIDRVVRSEHDRNRRLSAHFIVDAGLNLLAFLPRPI